MDPTAIVSAICESFEDVSVTEANGDAFFFVGDSPADQRMPFATLVGSDAHDRASDLSSRGAFRLNIGVSRETYEARFGPPPAGPIQADPIDTGHDYTRIDVLMPHPIYSPLHWVCVVNPSVATFEALQPLLEEGHAIAGGRRERRAGRERS